jgi:hypothetical protein
MNVKYPNKQTNKQTKESFLPCLTRGVSHCGFAIYLKKYLKAKKELWKEFKYFTTQKNDLLKTNVKFQHKPKYHFSKILI